METIFLLSIFGMLTGSLFAQDDYDCIERNSFSMVKTSLDVKTDHRKSVSLLRTAMDVENHCGSD